MITKMKIYAQEQWLFLTLGITVVAIAMVAARVNILFWGMDTVGSDTYYSWVEGRRVLEGKNPYERILDGNMQENRKYATYFPLFYEISAFVQFRGYEYYEEWIGFFRYVFLSFNLATSFALFVLTFSRRFWMLSLLAVVFWCFNRWTIFTSQTVALDFIPIFLMVLSLGLFERHRRLSLLLYSFSLAFKQIAVFIAPLYLIWEYQQSRSIKNVVVAGLLILSIPLLSSIPFLFWNLEGFVRSIAFSATRTAATQFGAESIDVVTYLEGLPARIPMLAVLFVAYLAAAQKALGRYGAALLVMGIFIGFNSVLFTHYLAWLMPLLPLAVSEWMSLHALQNTPGLNQSQGSNVQ